MCSMCILPGYDTAVQGVNTCHINSLFVFSETKYLIPNTLDVHL